MDLTIPANPAAGITSDASVRVAVINGVKMVSAYDVIRLVIEPTNNPRCYWARAIRKYPELTHGGKSHKFPGERQQITPVIDAKRVVVLLNVIPGRAAANFRLYSADIVVRYLGGDDKLVSEIQKNADVQQGLDDDDPMSIFGDELKRKRNEHIDELEPEDRAVKSFRAIKEGMELLDFIETSTMDGPTRLFMKDLTMNAFAKMSTRLVSQGSGERHLIPVSDIYHKVTGRRGDSVEWQRLGTALSKEYRKRHDGQAPLKSERLLHGSTRMMNAYSPIEDPWIEDFARDFLKD
jgi:hypothetical protein